MSVGSKRFPLWDWPVRAIHWLIALLIPASWWTAEEGYLDVHQWLGFTVLLAVLTRLCWGFVGSPQARFRDFLRGPGAVLGYFRGRSPSTPGHNPAGGWSAMALWSLLLLQVLTGTVNGDDVLFTGPFYYVFDSGVSDMLASWHELTFNILLGLIALHILAIAYYQRLRKQDLLRPMVLGVGGSGREGTGPARPWYLAVVIAVVLAAVIWGLLALAPEPPASDFYW